MKLIESLHSIKHISPTKMVKLNDIDTNQSTSEVLYGQLLKASGHPSFVNSSVLTPTNADSVDSEEESEEA